jgi:hypothetical protein
MPTIVTRVLLGSALLGAVLTGSTAPAGAAEVSRAHHARAVRWVLDIPGIGVSARVMKLGDPQDHGQVLPVPSLAQAADAGWYGFTAVPGAPGNAVIVGHVDTYIGPGVFYDLYLLRHGDKVDVDMGGRRARYTVNWVTEVPKAQFPASQIFGTTGRRRLWLITCGGGFDYATRHYLDNIIVSATWQPAAKRAPHRLKYRAPGKGAVRGINNLEYR